MAITNFQFPSPPDQLPESEIALRNRINLLSPIVEDFWAALVKQVGHEEAHRLWSHTIKQKKTKIGAPKKSKLKNDENLILYVHERMSGDPEPKTLIKFLAYQFDKEMHGKKGFPNREALEKRIRRLIDLRSKGKLKRIPSVGAIPQYEIIPDDDGH